jgi:putative glycerol-1-phosphate prenyltransferase
MNVLYPIIQKSKEGRKQLAYLIDPDKYQGAKLDEAIRLIKTTQPDMVMVGGSLVSVHIESTIHTLKQHISQPVILYPGSLLQLSFNADALLFLSLISGRNPELLIGNHVVAAPLLKQSNLEIIPTGYMLIDGGSKTSVEYMSNTAPIPASKNEIAVATALAGEMLGMKLIYMDAGSGASQPIHPAMIKAVKTSLTIPLMIGGGLNTPEKVKQACLAGADIIVIGNAIEKDPSLLHQFRTITQNQAI